MWKLIKIDFADANELKSHIFKITEIIEAKAHRQSLYFARYVNQHGGVAQVSFQSDQLSEDLLNELKQRFPSIQVITMNDRDEGSRIHGLGYEICKDLSLLNHPKMQEQLQDVVHWMHNMAGFGYQDEGGRYLSYARNAWRGFFHDNIVMLRSGDSGNTQIGFLNRNRQANHGTLGLAGNDHLQYAYRLECLNCGYVYGANGSDIAERRCPECQGGEPGIQYRT